MILNEKINKLFIYWLNTTLILVFLIIIVGGLTRLTNSGLSITEWELFVGIMPPTDNNMWNFYFNEYKKIPQYKLLNSGMSLSEFKVIFYWEYFHRILARTIGIFFLIPLIFFYFTKKINQNYIFNCFIILILIIIQGIVGWFMVKSGLVNNVTVSHYRLSIHLGLAFFIISSIYWLIRNFKSKQHIVFFKIKKNDIFFQILILLIFLQIIVGAFVSGLDAGLSYQTWPLMDEKYFPNDTLILGLKDLLDFNNRSLIQFYHRNLAYFIVLYVFILTFFIYKRKITKLYKSTNILLFFLTLQIILGIFTLISGLKIYLASAHQITSMLLVFSAINLYYLRTK